MKVPISTHNAPPSLFFATQWDKMAYNSHSDFDLRSQILENLRFVSWGSAQLKTLTARDPLGNYKVIVTIDEDEGCRPFLAETGETFQKALEALHNKSADLVHRHIESVGFEYRRRSRKKSPKTPKIVDDSDDGLLSASSDGSASPTLALSDMESADEAESDDDDIVSVVSDAGEKRASKHSIKSSPPPQPGPPKPPASTKPRINGDAESNIRPSPAGRPSPPLLPPVAPRAAVSFPPPPPPPGWRPIASGLPPPPRPPSMAFPPPHAPTLPPPVLNIRPQLQQQQPPAGPPGQLWDVRMAIKFLGRGEPHLLASVRPSIQELRKFALDYVLKNPAKFRASKPHLEQLRLQTMVSRVVLGQVGYDVSTYPKDDLTRLFTAGSADGGSDAQMPLVEVDVWPHWGPPTSVSVRSPPSSPPMSIVD